MKIVCTEDLLCKWSEKKPDQWCHFTYSCTGWHSKTGTFEKPNKNWRNPRKKNIDRNWTITTCLL